MRLVKTLVFMVITAGVIAGLLWYAGDRLDTLGRFLRVAEALTPQSADADGGAPPTEAAAPASPEAETAPAGAAAAPPTLAGDTQQKLGRIERGMTRDEVEAVLGRCAFARTEPGPGGSRVRTAMWMFDADMVGVRFRDGKVAMVIGSPLAALSEAEAPAAPAAGAAAKPPSGAPAQPAPAPAPANTTHQRWLELEKQLKQQSNPEEMLLKLFGERPASDGK